MQPLKSTLILLTALAGMQAQDVAAPGSQAGIQDPQGGQPMTPAPKNPPPPPPPPSERPAPPASQEAPQKNESGQWVYTSQYGWVWMPYGDGYTHVPTEGGTPNMYVYYPTVGWCWVLAPWLWGWGPAPYFGMIGPRFFGWWGVGLGHWYGFRGNWGPRGWWGGSYFHGGRWASVGPVGRSGAPRGGGGRGSAPRASAPRAGRR